MRDHPATRWTSRLALGSAQFGLDYGISNRAGRVAREEVHAIVKRAADNGIDLIDTASAYGSSEDILGLALAPLEDRPAVVSKLAPGTAAKEVASIARCSLARVGGDRLAAYLVHDSRDALDSELWNAMRQLVQDGVTDQVGVSVYHPYEVDDLWAANVDFTVIQLPFSVFDQRFAPLLPKLADRGVEIHVRSVFLQGLYFLPDERVPIPCRPALDSLRRLRALAEEHEIPMSALLLGWTMEHDDATRVVVGVTNVGELDDLIEARVYQGQIASITPELRDLAAVDEAVVLPYLWNT